MRRRTIVVGAGVVLVVAVAACALWWLWWPSYRPALRTGERYGIDVSNHQGTIDWGAVADDGIDVAYIKATEGGDHVDARFAESWDAARAAGIDVGAYHFFTLCTPGAAQATNVLRTVPDDGDLPLAVDLELTGNCSARPPAAQVRREVEELVRRVEAGLGRPVVLYVLDDWEELYPTRDLAEQEGRRSWHRRIGPLRPDGDWWMWQLSGRADVAGVDGGVDLNVVRG